MGPVVSVSCAYQALPKTIVFPEATARDAPPEETKTLEEVEEDLPTDRVELGPSAVKVP